MMDAGGPKRTIGGGLVHQGPPANFQRLDRLALTAAERRFGRMMPLAKAGSSEQRKVDDRVSNLQRGTVSPAETQPVVAAESRCGMHGFLRLGRLCEKTCGCSHIQRLAGHALFSHQEIHRVTLDQTPVQFRIFECVDSVMRPP